MTQNKSFRSRLYLEQRKLCSNSPKKNSNTIPSLSMEVNSKQNTRLSEIQVLIVVETDR